MTETVAEKLRLLPSSPGIYIMENGQNTDVEALILECNQRFYRRDS